MAFGIKAKSLVLSALVAMGATQVAQAEEKNGFFLGLGYQQGKAGGGEYTKALSSGFPIYGLDVRVGGVGFVNKWFGGQAYGFFDWNNSNQVGSTSNDKWNIYNYGAAADAIVNIIPTEPFALGLVGGIQLAGDTWNYNGFSHTGFQFLFNVGGRMRIMEHSSIQAGIKFPMIPQKLTAEMSDIRRYVWYVDYVFTF
ncbi:outer membrane protein [Helicobacter salomonis]|uniref:OMP488 n=1 Tax=Helicobacter salomonis TaxID=56878 RepID=A0A1M4NIB6_9HELI|nr:outer membrane protein [Helicobacter salomonis]SFZ72843.1 OMP488 [Helicobacter salomonis]SFZ73009.1 OMP665 [Helicobacter salomonis]